MGENDQGNLSVTSILFLVEKGISDEELQEILDKAVTNVGASIAKDKSSAKKKMAELLTLMTVLDRSLRQSQQIGQLQNSLKAMQNKINGLLKDGNVENIQKFLKSSELKTTLQQSITAVAKQPEGLRNVAENIGNRVRESQQKLSGQQQQNPNQKVEAQKQIQDVKTTGISQLMNRLVDKSKDFLGVNHVTVSKDLREQKSQQNSNNQQTKQLIQPPVNNAQMSQQIRQNPIQINSAQTINIKPNVTTSYVANLQQASHLQPSNNENIRKTETTANIAEKPLAKHEPKRQSQENVIPIRNFTNVSEPTIKASSPPPVNQAIQIASLKTTTTQTEPAQANPTNTSTPTAGKVLHGPGCPDCPPQVKEADLKKMNVAVDTINKSFDPNKRSQNIVEARSAVGEMKTARAAQGF